MATPKSTLDQLKQELKAGTLGRGYVLYGEETYLLQHYLGLLEKKLIDPMTQEFNFHRFSSETFSVDDLWDAVENLPMMADRTLVRVDDVDLFKLGEADRDKLIRLLSDLPEYCCLVFSYAASEYKADKRQKKLYDALSKALLTVEFPKQSPRDLVAWIGRHFKTHGKHISNDLCNYLIDITGGTMSALAGEIEKVAAFAPDGEIRRMDIDAVVEPVLDAVVFQMTDAIGAGNYSSALNQLNTLFKMQNEPIAILGAIGSHLRRLSAARILMDEGKTSDDLMSLCGLKDYPARKTMNAARQFSPRFCARAAQLVLETDHRLKTSFDEPKRLMEQLLLQLAQEAGRG